MGTYTVITTTANALVEPIHPTRMSAILTPHVYEICLHGKEQDVLDLLKPFPNDEMRIAKQGFAE